MKILRPVRAQNNSDLTQPLKMVIRKRGEKNTQKVIELTKDKIVFGSSTKADHQLEGDKIAKKHFEVRCYNNNYILRNLNHNISESYGVYK